MQTAPKTPRIKFAVRVLAVTLCLTIGLSGVVIPARAIDNPFPGIATILAGEGIASNIGTVPWPPPDCCKITGLYFEKRTDVNIESTALGRMTFTEELDLSNPLTIAFLQDLGNKMQMSNGLIALDASTSAEFRAHGATLVMYGIPPGRTIADITVSADDGTIIPTADVVTGFTQDPVTNNVSFNAAHFTKFEINTTRTGFQIFLPLVIR